VNDTTSTPDGPDGHGRVATGGEADVPEQADGAAAPNADRAASNGAPGAAQPGAAQPVPPPPAPGAPAGSDTPTTELRLPRPSPGPRPGPSAPGEVPGTPVPEPPDAEHPQASGPSPAPRAPEAAPGPVPGPGPDAVTPPPWDRIPGSEPAPRPRQVPPREPVIGGLLLDEGPTAYIEPPGTSDEQRGGGGTTAAKGSATSDSGSWTSVRTGRSRPPRQAALQLKRLDPWSVLKLGLVLAVVLFFIWLVAVGVLYGVLDGMGVWDRLNGTYADLVSGESPGGSPLISAGRVFGFAAVIGAINSLLFAVAVTVGAFVYNVSADLVGGIEVTLSERD